VRTVDGASPPAIRSTTPRSIQRRAGRRPLDAPCCVEQELSSSDMRSTNPQVRTIDLTKLH
jgi:hypothetical protein